MMRSFRKFRTPAGLSVIHRLGNTGVVSLTKELRTRHNDRLGDTLQFDEELEFSAHTFGLYDAFHLVFLIIVLGGVAIRVSDLTLWEWDAGFRESRVIFVGMMLVIWYQLTPTNILPLLDYRRGWVRVLGDGEPDLVALPLLDTIAVLEGGTVPMLTQVSGPFG
jgi:hypothetical protein